MDIFSQNILAPILAALGTLFTTWLNSRFPATRRLERTLEQSTKVLDLVERCNKLDSDLRAKGDSENAEVRQILATLLERTGLELSREIQRAQGSDSDASKLGRFMWFSGGSKPAFWLPRLLFYFLLFLPIILLVLRMLNPHSQYQSVDFGIAVILIALALVIRASFRDTP